MRTRLPAAATLSVVLLALTACGSDDDNDPPAPPAAPAGSATAPAATAPAAPGSPAGGAPGQAELERAVRAYSEAYLTGQDDAAYAILSRRCQGALPKELFAQMTAIAKELYGNLPISSLKVDKLDGAQATVTYTFSVPALNQQAQSWKAEDGRWRHDGC